MRILQATLTLAVIAYAIPARADVAADVAACVADAKQHPSIPVVHVLQPSLAQVHLGLMYRKAAEQGNALAAAKLGDQYYLGWGVPVDDAEAVCWYRKAAELGNASAKLQLARIYSGGVPEDLAEAVRWYRKAADQGIAEAQRKLGIMYSYMDTYTDRMGVPEDDAEGVRWLRKAADQGDASAQFYLGKCYDYGKGIPKDYVQAYMWYNLAAATEKSVDLAAEFRDTLAHSMTREQIAEGQRRAAAWRPAPSRQQQPACSKDEQELTRLARKNGYQYNSACN
jgi:TPR repeat protein